MQFSTDTLDISIKVGDIVLDNVNDFCYLGHTIFNDDKNSTELRIPKATAKFHGMFCGIMKYTYISVKSTLKRVLDQDWRMALSLGNLRKKK